MRIGVDVLAIGELDRLHTRGWFRRHTYDERELELAGSLSPSRAREFLAGRFAAKEAVLKVLGTGFGKGISPAHVSVLRDDRSAPVVRLAGAAARRAGELGIGAITVSIAHKNECVVAVAIGDTSPGDTALGTDLAAAGARIALDKIARSRADIGKARNSHA
ncbi:holo-ACP synthase [Streptomyces rhizosphaericola]|uniref:Holo-[acyl-carrier-protein] synthase n=2 Tax=Streptomyces TaxID=1883 RepID=A0A1E7M2G5_9ACTN|nr:MULTISPECIES: holo-ACP synthase [Streptomyces]MYT93053.1 holo-[acyl-carrier-protein] synthase [Streptomyces sp. SID8359]OEV22679.1 ACP synthase [Streptomyces nanshensis]